MNNTSVRSSLRRPSMWRPSVGVPIVALGGLGTALVLVHSGPTSAIALVLLGPLALLLTRSYGGLVVGATMVLTLPYSLGLGSAQLTLDRVASAVAVVSMAIAALSGRRWHWHRTDAAVLLYFGVIVLGWLLQNYQPHVGRLVIGELTPIGFYLAARRIPRQHVRLVMFSIFFAGAIGALTVLFERAVGHQVFPSPLNAAAYAGSLTAVFRPSGVFGAPPLAGAVLDFVLLIGLACVSLARGRVRVLAIVGVLTCGLAVILTFTRADIIGAAIGILIFLVLVRSPVVRPLRAVLMIVTIATMVVAVLPSAQQSVTFQQGIVRPGSLSSRESVWRIALPIATSSTHNLVVGIGTGVFENPIQESQVAAAPSTVTAGIQNQYLTTLVENGLVGLVALLVVLASPIVTAGRSAIRDRDPIHASLAAAVVALAIGLIANTVLLDSPVDVLFLSAAGLVANLAGGPRSSPVGR